MKKNFLLVILMVIVLIGIIGCKKDVDQAKLNEVNDKIIEYFSSDYVEYDNLSFSYIDEANGKVVVGLLDNSKEQRDKFKKLVVDSDLIEFIQGKELINYTNNN